MFDLPTFTLVHVVVSVLAVITGLIVVGGLMAGSRMDGWTLAFLGTTLYTSVSGFGFPFTEISPPHIVGVISLAVLAVCIFARYPRHMQGHWRDVYVTSAVVALYLNVFVLVVQLFTKTPPLAQLAPTQREAPFAVSQALILVVFVGLGWAAVRGARLGRPRA